MNICQQSCFASVDLFDLSFLKTVFLFFVYRFDEQPANQLSASQSSSTTRAVYEGNMANIYAWLDETERILAIPIRPAEEDQLEELLDQVRVSVRNFELFTVLSKDPCSIDQNQ